ncbi:MAG TPA: hypothetical protein VK453_25460 [Micromonosporaceae bacterium]|nr:hypothetical protein [Micromonosporaceae bacterium]
MHGWPKLSPAERVVVAKVGGAAEYELNAPEAEDRTDIADLLAEVADPDRRRLVLAMAAQAYVDEEHGHRVAQLIERDHGADLALARQYRQARLKRQGFDLAKMVESKDPK